MADLVKTLIIGGAAAAGAGLVYYAIRNRAGVVRVVKVTEEQLRGATEKIVAAAAPVAAAVTAPVAAAARKAVKLMSGIPQLVLDNFKKYNLIALIDKYADGFPFGLAGGIIYVESKGDAQAENKSGATGVVQILGGKNSRGLTKEQRLDPDASLRVIMPEWRRFLQQAIDAGVTDQRDQWSYVYYGHNQGAGALKTVLRYAGEGFEQSLQHYRSFTWLRPKSYKDELAAAKKEKRAARAMTAEEQAAYDAAVSKHIAAATRVARLAADKGAEFAAAEADLRGGAAVVGAAFADDDAAPVPVPGPADAAEELNRQLQAAYLARDLNEVARLQDELSVLVDDFDEGFDNGSDTGAGGEVA